jgi:hypothetical protein
MIDIIQASNRSSVALLGSLCVHELGVIHQRAESNVTCKMRLLLPLVGLLCLISQSLVHLLEGPVDLQSHFTQLEGP